ncbi:hypothetical protein CDV55_107080 [Aspergillus turcosus]|uniref:Cell wall protein PhiA n=1 Tax=Aspergillus turcosus TaxID=1245748 RepID=A0A229XG86_9EURO|nr:hypothetical protein CDV55_107080 [Aspergillus turcosus]RLL98490.1 hypothetical protein CFD26_103921 [Aspergillus turcosus]
MQLKNFILAASAAATASAAACPAPSSKYFSVVAIHSGSDVQYKPFNAAVGSILAGLKSQNATCDSPDQQYATFYLQDGSLNLYSTSTTQEIYVDASGMGEGVIQYTTGGQGIPAGVSLNGWAINDENLLQWNNKSLIACPNSIDGAWSIWADAGVANPGGNTDCVSIAARVEEVFNPNSCVYTQ